MIDNTFLYPGDNLFNPEITVNILALLVSEPWLTLEDSINFAQLLNLTTAFPVHDGMLKHLGSTHVLPQKLLGEVGIDFKPFLAGKSIEV